MNGLKIYADAVKEDFPELSCIVDNMLILANSRIAQLEAKLNQLVGPPPDKEKLRESPDNIRTDRQTTAITEKLLVDSKLTKNYGPKHLIFDLRSLNIPESKIPTYKQLQNKLFYFRKTQFNHVNEIEPLVEKLCPLVFTGEEAMEQPFVYHYATDEDDHLTVGDGSER